MTEIYSLGFITLISEHGSGNSVFFIKVIRIQQTDQFPLPHACANSQVVKGIVPILFSPSSQKKKLRLIFEEIDKMERTKIEVRAFRKYAELFYNWA